MKLYYAPGACSMASHIVIKELALPAEAVKVDFASRKTEHGEDFYAVNPEGYVPALALDDGGVLTESAAILQYLADQSSDSGLLPPVGDDRRYRVLEMQAYMSTEIHQKLGPFVDPTATEENKAAATAKIHKRLGRIEKLLANQQFLTGDSFTIADAYAFAALGGVQHFGVPLDGFPNVGRFLGQVASRPAVQDMLRAEGLMQ